MAQQRKKSINALAGITPKLRGAKTIGKEVSHYVRKTVLQKYGDIIELPHHVSSKHPQMPNSQRAAQFSPFAALTGHNAEQHAWPIKK